jgi:hypothetical protein
MAVVSIVCDVVNVRRALVDWTENGQAQGKWFKQWEWGQTFVYCLITIGGIVAVVLRLEVVVNRSFFPLTTVVTALAHRSLTRAASSAHTPQWHDTILVSHFEYSCALLLKFL